MASLRNKKLVLAPAQEYDFPLHGDSIRVVSASVPIYFKTANGDLDFYLEQGEKATFEGNDFLTLVIYHLDGADQNVIISIGKDADIGSAKFSGSVAITNATAGAFTQGRASVTNVNQAIIAANAARKYLLIQNNDVSQVLRVNLAGVAATAAQGFRVQAGASLELSGFVASAGINAIMEAATAAAENVEFTEA